jgi:polynucleotide 5'-kinase involved in rRNA processing
MEEAKSNGGESAAPAGPSGPPPSRRKPVVCLFMGMAGSGKTTLVQRLNLHLNEKVSPADLCYLALVEAL